MLIRGKPRNPFVNGEAAMPLLTLTSDIGNQDFLTGAIRARLLGDNNANKVIEITNNITPFNYPQAAYICRNAIKNFPDFSFHIILVNLFDRKTRHMLMAFHKNKYLLCADNGLLNMILEDKPEMVIGLPMEKEQASNTLACVDIFAKAIEQISNGTPLEKIGNPDVSYVEMNPIRPAISDDWIEGQIIYIDNFENVIVNITHEDFENIRKGRHFEIIFRRDEVIDHISDTYADVPEGEKLALFNSAGYLEIAINKGNAAGLFGLKGFTEKNNQARQLLQSHLFYNTVRITFK